MKYSFNEYYHGNWLNNKKHGIGTYKWSHDEIYKGAWIDDEILGYGV